MRFFTLNHNALNTKKIIISDAATLKLLYFKMI
jgi:hypothetical protein